MQTFIKALGISFLGSLPIGIMNMSALQVALNQGVAGALAFSCTAIMIEGLIMMGTGVLATKITSENRRMAQLHQVSMVLLFCMGIFFLVRALIPAAPLQQSAATTEMPGWLYGISLRILNPTAIIYWFGIHVALGQSSEAGRGYYTRFAVGGMTGTFLAYSVYIMAAHQLGSYLVPLSTNINIFLAALCLIGLIYQWRTSPHK